MPLAWRDQLSVGNEVLDSDHRYLIDIINLVERSFETKNRNDLSYALNSLSQYSKRHFVYEESVARAVGYSQVPNLSQSHESLTRQLEQAKLEIDNMGGEWSPEVVERFTQFLRDWLINHVIKEDLLMKASLQKYPPNFTPKK